MKSVTIQDALRAAPRVTLDEVKAACAKYPHIRFETMEDLCRLQTIVRLSVGDVHRLVHIDHMDLWAAVNGRDVKPHPFDLIEEAVANMPSGLEVASGIDTSNVKGVG